jgi:hypothetical protein
MQPPKKIELIDIKNDEFRLQKIGIFQFSLSFVVIWQLSPFFLSKLGTQMKENEVLDLTM